MGIELGSGSIGKLYLGSTEITKAYLGSTEIYSNAAGGSTISGHGTLTTGLVAAWDMEDNTDSHSSNDLTVSGASLTTGGGGLIEEGYNVDGVNDFLSTGVVLANVATIQVAAYFPTFSAQGCVYGSRTSGGGNRGCFLIHQASNTCRIVFYKSTTEDVSISGTIVENAWNIITVTRNGENVELFVGTSSQGTDTGTGLNTHVEQIVFGRNGDQAIQHFAGKVDLGRIWTKVLSSQEITDSVNGGAGLPYD